MLAYSTGTFPFTLKCLLKIYYIRYHPRFLYVRKKKCKLWGAEKSSCRYTYENKAQMKRESVSKVLLLKEWLTTYFFKVYR